MVLSFKSSDFSRPSLSFNFKESFEIVTQSLLLSFCEAYKFGTFFLEILSFYLYFQ